MSPVHVGGGVVVSSGFRAPRQPGRCDDCQTRDLCLAAGACWPDGAPSEPPAAAAAERDRRRAELRALLDAPALSVPLPRPTTTSADVVAWLRAAPLDEIRRALADSRVCDGWAHYDDEGRPVDEDDEDDEGPGWDWARLSTIGDHLAASVSESARWAHGRFWVGRVYVPERPGDPGNELGPFGDRAEAVQAVERRAVEAGYRLPWRT